MASLGSARISAAPESESQMRRQRNVVLRILIAADMVRLEVIYIDSMRELKF